MSTAHIPQYVAVGDIQFTQGPRTGQLTTIRLCYIYEHQGCRDLQQARAHMDFMYGPHAHFSAGDGSYSYRINNIIVAEIL